MAVRIGAWALLLGTCLAGQWVPRGRLTEHRPLPQGVELTYEGACLRVEFLCAHVVRVRVEKDASFPQRPSFAVLPRAQWGWHVPQVRVAQTERGLLVAARGGVRVRVVGPEGRLHFESPEEEPFLTEDRRTSARRAGGTLTQAWFVLPPDEHYFGFGEKAGPLDKRGAAFTMWNTDAYYYGSGTDPLYQSIPFFLAIRKGRAYGLFLDAPERSSFDMGRLESDTFSFLSHADYLDYYVIYGPQPKAVLTRFTDLVGRIPLPPLWALGYQQCRYSYYPESRVRALAREFRRRRIPCDVIYLDIDYMRGYRSFTWDEGRFPDFKGMIRELRAQGFQVVVIVDPGIKAENGYFVYDQGVAGDHFVKNPDGSLYRGEVWPGECVFPDFHRPETRRWWGGLYREFVRLGIRGVWNDMNEPSIFNGPGHTMPLDVVHRAWGEPRPHAYCHNTYGMQMARATREGLEALLPNERVFVLSRANYAGGHRYAAGWTGDNRSYWEHLQQSVPMVLNWSVSGQAFCGPDVGGFTGSPSPELLTRWLQLGAFLPLYRNHSSIGTKDQEPWVHGDPYTGINRRFIELRYELLPYLYSLFAECARTGVPVARLPLLEFPEWEEVLRPYREHEFLLGPSLLVCPVVQISPRRWSVLLPRGLWYDFWSGKEIHSDGKAFRVDVSLERIPVYVRAGAIVPRQAPVQHTGEKPAGPLRIEAYPGESARSFAFYEDDGRSYEYRRGAFRRTYMECVRTEDGVRFAVTKVEGQWGPRSGPVLVVVHGFPRLPGGVRAAGRPVRDWRYDPERGAVEVDLEGLPAGLVLEVVNRPTGR